MSRVCHFPRPPESALLRALQTCQYIFCLKVNWMIAWEKSRTHPPLSSSLHNNFRHLSMCLLCSWNTFRRCFLLCHSVTWLMSTLVWRHWFLENAVNTDFTLNWNQISCYSHKWNHFWTHWVLLCQISLFFKCPKQRHMKSCNLHAYRWIWKIYSENLLWVHNIVLLLSKFFTHLMKLNLPWLLWKILHVSRWAVFSV